ncbi:MAG: glucosamine-6-phosphate deaminase [Candidatus Omnitrophica bacterium COP1]|nr:glucosamine-6-phosphate deaminase [Candidatus Omnitrophica bacterium COP1]
MRVVFQETPEQVGVWAARTVARRILDYKPTARKPFVLGLPTGSSPLGMYKELIRLNKRGKISFANVVTFNMDEYVGLDPDHPQSYHRFMWDHFFGHIDIKKKNANILDGLASDLGKECLSYEKRIESYGGISLFVGGIGEDGHLAFNEPGSSLQSRTRIKTLTDDTRKVNARFFGGNFEKVPKLALTVGVGTIMAADEVMILVTGFNKARALQKTVEEGVNHIWTASVLQLHRHALIVADTAAANELKVGTYHYFRSVEAGHFDPDSILKG